MKKIEELLHVIEGHKVFIQTHNFPDPDAIGAAFGIQQLLEEYGVESQIVYKGTLDKLSVVRMLDFTGIKVHEISTVDHMTEEDYIILVDCQKNNKNVTDFIGDEVACIDHHPVFEECEYKYIDIKMVGSCSSVVAGYYFESGKIPSIEVATALIYGMKIDTNDFSRGVTEFDVEMYFKLFKYADKTILQKLALNSICFEDLRAYGAAINDISLFDNIGFAVLPFDCPDGLIGVISDFILALDVVDACVVYSIRPDGYKFSMRSEIDRVDAGKVLNSVLKGLNGNGGGHAFMAGGFLPNESVKTLGEEPRLSLEKLFVGAIYPGIDIGEDGFIRGNEGHCKWHHKD